MKKLLSFLLLTSLFYFNNYLLGGSGDNWTFIQKTSFYGQVNDKIAIHISQQNWFSQRNDHILSDIDPMLELAINNDGFVGLNCPYYFYRTDTNEIRHEYNPCVVLDYNIKSRILPMKLGGAVFYRVIENAENRGVLALKFGADFFRCKNVKLHAETKFYYNYFSLQQIDRNKTTFKIKGKISDFVDLSLFYRAQFIKIETGKVWRGYNFLGLNLIFNY